MAWLAGKMPKGGFHSSQSSQNTQMFKSDMKAKSVGIAILMGLRLKCEYENQNFSFYLTVFTHRYVKQHLLNQISEILGEK